MMPTSCLCPLWAVLKYGEKLANVEYKNHLGTVDGQGCRVGGHASGGIGDEIIVVQSLAIPVILR